MPPPTDAPSFAASGLPEAFKLRGDVDTIADFGDGNPYTPAGLLGALDQLSPDLRELVGEGQLGYAWQTLQGQPVLVVGGRQGASPDLFFVFPAADVEAALAQLRLGLVAAGLLAVLVALITAGFIARGHPPAGRRGGPRGANDRRGRPHARACPRAGTTSSGAGPPSSTGWRPRSRRPSAGSRAAQQQNRRFVADVSHELRTPLTALVGEASLIESGTAGMTPDARRAAELLVADIRRLRVLVDELMEISRFDADAEQPSLEPVDLGRVVSAVVGSRLPAAAISLPASAVVVESDPRRLDRILGNLLDNARDHAPDGPVEVSLTRTAVGAVVVVADRGPGRPALTRCRTCSTASTRPTRPGAAAAPAWASRSPRSTRR